MKDTIAKKISSVMLSIWWGAFTFYSGVVINVGMQVLGSHTEMGFITQAVTNYLNFISFPILVFMAYTFRTEKRFFTTALLLVFLQAILFFLHFELDKLLDIEQRIILNRATFYSFHRVYLLISTLIWLIVSGILILTVRNL